MDGDVDDAVLDGDMDNTVVWMETWTMQCWMVIRIIQWCGWLPREAVTYCVSSFQPTTHTAGWPLLFHQSASLHTATAMVSTGEAWVLVGVAILVWGSFTVPIKCKAVQDAQLHPLVFQASILHPSRPIHQCIWQTYMSMAVAVSSLVALAIEKPSWTWWGFAGAALWYPDLSSRKRVTVCRCLPLFATVSLFAAAATVCQCITVATADTVVAVVTACHW